jgi:hypothetical protein
MSACGRLSWRPFHNSARPQIGLDHCATALFLGLRNEPNSYFWSQFVPALFIAAKTQPLDGQTALLQEAVGETPSTSAQRI